MKRHSGISLRLLLVAFVAVGLVSLVIENSRGTFMPRPQLPSNAFHFASVAISSDGSHLVAVPYGLHAVLTSTDYGKTWLTRSVPLEFSDRRTGEHGVVALSADGKRIAVVSDKSPGGLSGGGYIYTSRDFGGTWVKRAPSSSMTWTAISGSASGRYLVAEGAPLPNPDASAFASNPASIYSSKDFGATWSKSDSIAPSETFAIIGISDNGKLDVSDGMKNYHSVDAGLNWIASTSPSSSGFISGYSNPSGTVLYATDGTGVYRSSDFGRTWIHNDPSTLSNIIFLISSSDGLRVIVLESNGHLYSSKDSGSTWIPENSSSTLYWSLGIVADESGHHLLTMARGDVYTSDDSGKSWVNRSNDLYRDWDSLVMSGDGTHLFAASYDGCGWEECPPSATDLFTSSDFGMSWTARGSDAPVQTESLPGVASSLWSDETGKTIYSDQIGTPEILSSRDGGFTWLSLSAKSPRGIFANEVYSENERVGITFDDNYNIFITLDSGKKWAKVTPQGLISPSTTQTIIDDDLTLLRVSINGDGHIIAAETNSRFFISINQGKTWIHHAAPWAQDGLKQHYECTNEQGTVISSLVDSGDNTIQSVISPPDWSLYQSTNFGKTWKRILIPVELRSTLLWNFGLQCTSDEKHMYLLGNDPYVSTDYGRSWGPIKSSGSRDWKKLTFSEDGSHLAALGSEKSAIKLGSHIYVSKNFGKTWSDLTNTGRVDWASS